jgi:hypothetical protein
MKRKDSETLNVGGIESIVKNMSVKDSIEIVRKEFELFLFVSLKTW